MMCLCQEQFIKGAFTAGHDVSFAVFGKQYSPLKPHDLYSVINLIHSIDRLAVS